MANRPTTSAPIMERLAELAWLAFGAVVVILASSIFVGSVIATALIATICPPMSVALAVGLGGGAIIGAVLFHVATREA